MTAGNSFLSARGLGLDYGRFTYGLTHTNKSQNAVFGGDSNDYMSELSVVYHPTGVIDLTLSGGRIRVISTARTRLSTGCASYAMRPAMRNSIISGGILIFKCKRHPRGLRLARTKKMRL